MSESQARLKDDISEEYKVWKADTLAKQTGHMELVEHIAQLQRPEIHIQHRDNKDRNSFEIQIAPGYR